VVLEVLEDVVHLLGLRGSGAAVPDLAPDCPARLDSVVPAELPHQLERVPRQVLIYRIAVAAVVVLDCKLLPVAEDQGPIVAVEKPHDDGARLTRCSRQDMGQLYCTCGCWHAGKFAFVDCPSEDGGDGSLEGEVPYQVGLLGDVVGDGQVVDPDGVVPAVLLYLVEFVLESADLLC